jgi:hypothetical protein
MLLDSNIVIGAPKPGAELLAGYLADRNSHIRAATRKVGIRVGRASRL